MQTTRVLLVGAVAIASVLLSMACDEGAAPPDAASGDAGLVDAQMSRPDAGAAEAPAAARCTVEPPTDCPDAAPRFADVQPVFTSRCVRCHFGAEGGPWPLMTYRHIADWSSVVRDHIQLCLMPPADSGIEMPDSERRLILDWIRCGLPE